MTLGNRGEDSLDEFYFIRRRRKNTPQPATVKKSIDPGSGTAVAVS